MAAKDVDVKLYEHFEADERLTLWFEALARKDEAEADRLYSSCPQLTYKQTDEAFQGRIRIAFDILAVASIDLRAMWAKLHILHWAAELVKEFSGMNLITADLAFVEGMRCAQGRRQMDYFRKELTPLRVDGYEREDEIAEGDHDDEDDPDAEEKQAILTDLEEEEEIDEDAPATAEQMERGE